MPAGSSTASQSAVVRLAKISSSIGSSEAACVRRSAKVAKRASASAGTFRTATRRCQNFSLAQPTTTQPSAVGKSWNGTSDGCAEYRVRDGVKPALRCQAAG